VFVVGVCRDEKRLARVDFFEKVLSVEMPSKGDRKDYLYSFLSRHNCPEMADGEGLDEILSKTVGYTFEKMDLLLQRALLVLKNSSPVHKVDGDDVGDDLVEGMEKMSLNATNFFTVIKGILEEERDTPSTITQQLEFFPEQPRGSWQAVKGYPDLKEKLIQLVSWPLEHPNVFSRLGVRPPSGILLHGPSGVGKTMLVHGIANKVAMNFIHPRTYVPLALGGPF